MTSLPGWRGLKIKFLREGVVSASYSHLADEAAGWTGLGASEGPPQTSGAPQACQASGPPWPVESERSFQQDPGVRVTLRLEGTGQPRHWASRAKLSQQ